MNENAHASVLPFLVESPRFAGYVDYILYSILDGWLSLAWVCNLKEG
jgi:hypothetical protein